MAAIVLMGSPRMLGIFAPIEMTSFNSGFGFA